MNKNKFIMAFLVAGLVAAVLLCGFNMLIDPFGVFGDRVLNWQSYNMVNNPRIGKIAYLDNNHDKYDSYIIGGSKSSSINPELLNEYYDDASFYSMMMYGGDFYDYEKTLHYLVENYEVKNIIIHKSGHEIDHYNEEDLAINTELSPKVLGVPDWKYYGRFATLNLKYSFTKIEGLFRRMLDPFEYSQIIPESGVYNKVKRDAEDLGSMDEYLTKNPEFLWPLPEVRGLAIDDNVAALERMKTYCEARGISFTFIVAPNYYIEVDKYQERDMIDYFEKMADVTDFWDFSGLTTISYDPRNFYDRMHYRNNVGIMMVERMFGDGEDVPNDFGRLVTKENVNAILNMKFPDEFSEVKEERAKNEAVKVPIIMYHHIVEGADPQNASRITPEKFESDMKAFKEAGFETIFYSDLLGYVNGYGSLPEKPLLITFDDGYLSNYEIAYPVLKDLDMKATISIVGWSVGQTHHKDTGKLITEHFTWQQGREMVESGVIDIQNHSFDLHNYEEGNSQVRYGTLQMEGESPKAYVDAIGEDVLEMKYLIETKTGSNNFVYTYPYGAYDTMTEKVLKDVGFKVTVTVDEGMNLISRKPEDLYLLKRYNAASWRPSDELVRLASE